MKRYGRFTLAAAFLTAALGGLGSGGRSVAQAAPIPPCDVRLRVELTPDVPDPRAGGFVSSLLGNHPDYRLTVLRRDSGDASVIILDLTGPGPMAGCREVVNSMRKDSRVLSVDVQRDAGAQPTISTAQAPGVQAVSTRQPMGTVQAGPDGDWILTRSSGVSYAQQARVRYQCDVWAADVTGFDPTEEDGGVPPQDVNRKRADYLGAEAACFEANGYIAR